MQYVRPRVYGAYTRGRTCSASTRPPRARSRSAPPEQRALRCGLSGRRPAGTRKRHTQPLALLHSISVSRVDFAALLCAARVKSVEKRETRNVTASKVSRVHRCDKGGGGCFSNLFEYTQQSAGAHTSFEASVNTHVGAHMTGCGLLPSKKRAHRPGDAVSKTCSTCCRPRSCTARGGSACCCWIDCVRRVGTSNRF